MADITINIREANRSQKYKSDEFFQIKAFNIISKILQEHKNPNVNTEYITDCRFHDTIFIDGDRGLGKTAFMINIENYYENIAKVDKPKYIFLKPVDPTLLEHTEKFLSVILARIVEYVNDNKQCINKEFDEESYYKSLENLSKSLEAIKTLKDDVGIEEIASNKSSLKLEQYAHDFFKVVSEIFNANAIVMLIDDIDMAFDKGFDVLEVVRKYLASPYLIPIVAGDMKLYREIVETRFIDKLGLHKDISSHSMIKDIFEKGCSDEKEVIKNWDTSKIGCDHQVLIKNRQELKYKNELLSNLVEQYIKKLFPSEYRIHLEDIFTILKENRVSVKLNDELTVPYTEIKDFETRHINLGINQVKFTYKIFSNNTRDLMQYLFAKKDIYIKFFEDIKDKYSSDATHKAYEPKSVIAKYDKDIFKYVIQEPSVYKESLDITSKMYEYNDGKKKELSRLTGNDVKSFENSTYNIYKAFTGDVFTESKLVTEKEEYRLALYYKSYEEASNNLDDMGKFTVDLFVHSNYYTQENGTKRFIFSGKFVELMFFSLQKVTNSDSKTDECIDELFKGKIENLENFKEINKDASKCIEEYKEKLSDSQTTHGNISSILEKIPFNSSFSYNKNYEYTKSLANIEDSTDDIPTLFPSIEFLSDLEKRIIAWRNIFLDDVRINSISMYEIMHKFFNNLNLLKHERLADEKPIFFLQRIVFIFINAVAFFENTNTRVAQRNIAMAKNFDIKVLIEKTNAYTQNIKPLLEEKSLTRALFFHPVISSILFTDNLLETLRFVTSKPPRKIFDDLTKNIKSFEINTKIKILTQILELNNSEIKEISKLDKFKSVISPSSSKDNEKQEEFKRLKADVEKIIKDD